jgi:hypothetical protein
MPARAAERSAAPPSTAARGCTRPGPRAAGRLRPRASPSGYANSVEPGTFRSLDRPPRAAPHLPAMAPGGCPSPALTPPGGWSGDSQPPHHTARRQPACQGSDHVRDARHHHVAYRGRPRRRRRHRPAPPGNRRRHTVGPASGRPRRRHRRAHRGLLETVLPAADDDEPGTGEAFERAAELGDDARRHLVTASSPGYRSVPPTLRYNLAQPIVLR